MKSRLLITAALFLFGSLAASRIIDDETMLSNAGYYNPFLPRPKMVSINHDDGRLTFCDPRRTVPAEPDACDLPTSAEDSFEQLEERYHNLRAARERFLGMSPELRQQFEQKKKTELLAKPRLKRWDLPVYSVQ